MDDFDTSKIKLEECTDRQSVWNNDESTTYIKEEPIEFIEDVIYMDQEVNNEIFRNDNQEGYEQSNDLIDIKYEEIEYIKEENQPELGFLTEDIHKSKKILESYHKTFGDEFILKLPLRIRPHPCKSHLTKQLTNRSHVCEVCKKGFQYKSHLARHLSVHTGGKPYDCNICSKSFHLRDHTANRPFQCNICKKSFAANKHLIRHLRMHSGEKPYHCHICKKCFSQKSHLSTHLLIHSGDKPYKCNLCEKAFTNNSDLTKHSRTHTKGKPYQCNICAKLFSQRPYLAKHIRIHS